MPSEVSFEKDGDSQWGFQLTGGATFEMPLTVFEVQEGSKADKAGLRLGDVLVKINGMETDKLTLEQAHDIINNAGKNINLAVANLEDQEAEERQKLEVMDLEDEDERVDVSKLDLMPPRPAPQPEMAKRKCWHPVVLDTSPPPIIVESTGDEEAPHKKLMRNLRKAMDMRKIQQPSPEGQGPPQRKPPPPPADEEELESDKAERSMADQLRSMQRQIAALSTLPAVLQQSLSIVSQNLTRMLPPEPELEPELELEEQPETEVEYTEEDYTNEYVTEDEVSAREPTPEPESEEYLEPVEDPDLEPEPEPEPEPTIEELEKLDKLRKLKELNRVWPWGDNIKPVYKISDRYKVPHSELFSNKIQSLESKIILKKAPEVYEE